MRFLTIFAAVSLAALAQEEVPLWSSGPALGGEVAVAGTANDGLRRVAGIHRPSITVYPANVSTPAPAVIILPGGGHRYLSIDNEGHTFARWLSERGVAALVLKYRLARETGSSYKVEVEALADTLRAIRVVRHRAMEWKLDPQRIGVLGFSAGGQLAGMAAARFDNGKPDDTDPVERESARPSFQALIYPGAVNETAKDAPRAFFCVAADDKGPAATSLKLFQQLREAGVDAELHVYSKGGHGFGMKARPDFPVTGWPDRFLAWLKSS